MFCYEDLPKYSKTAPIGWVASAPQLSICQPLVRLNVSVGVLSLVYIISCITDFYCIFAYAGRLSVSLGAILYWFHYFIVSTPSTVPATVLPPGDYTCSNCIEIGHRYLPLVTIRVLKLQSVASRVIFIMQCIGCTWSHVAHLSIIIMICSHINHVFHGEEITT